MSLEQPTHQWCPKCSALLPAHMEVCPRCQTNLKTGQNGPGWREMLPITAVMIGVMIIPIIVVLAIGLICISTFD